MAVTKRLTAAPSLNHSRAKQIPAGRDRAYAHVASLHNELRPTAHEAKHAVHLRLQHGPRQDLVGADPADRCETHSAVKAEG